MGKVAKANKRNEVRAIPHSRPQRNRELPLRLRNNIAPPSNNRGQDVADRRSMIKIGGISLPYTEKNGVLEEEKRQLKAAIERRRERGEKFGIPKGAIELMVNTARRRMGEFRHLQIYGKNDVPPTFEINALEGLALLRHDRARLKKENPREYQIKKNEVEDFCHVTLKNMLLKVENKRYEVKLNDKMSLYFNKSQMPKIPQVGATVHCEYIEENKPIVEHFGTSYTNDQQTLKSYEKKKHVCRCTGGHCGKQCPCVMTNDQLTQGSNPVRPRHVCTALCGCEGKCSNSLAPLPENCLEVTLHPETAKGAVVRTKVYFGAGEVLSEMRGTISPTETYEDSAYAFDSYTEGHKEIVEEAFAKNKKIEKGKPQSFLTPKYYSDLKQVLGTALTIDPEEKSCQGRYISSSCLGNCETVLVFQNGLNPLNARVMIQSFVPIYPCQEPTFCYSTYYAYKQLSDVCLCGELVCVRNSHLFPYIEKKHLVEFYTNYITALHNNLLERTS